MCGIAGFLLHDSAADEAVIRAMCGRIRHRGPDDEGVFTDGRCAIGMRRLSIIDLGGGHQPIGNEDGSLQIVFNGEIYNYRDLRCQLERRGHRFVTHSDTETLVHLYEDEGAEGLQRLRGMFAFAIWDRRRQTLFLARDRFGKKPLYYADTPEGLYFASELKCLHAAGVPLDIDRDALRLYFQFTYLPDPYTPYRNVRKLEPGCWLEQQAGAMRRHGRYWRMPAFTAGACESGTIQVVREGGLSNGEAKSRVPGARRGNSSRGMTEDDACERLREVFDESVRLRLVADVPLGAFLSGGIDSGCVVASMARQSSGPVKTFSIGFEESAYNELDAARLVAHLYGTEHHEILVRPDSVALVVEKLVAHFDEPFGDSSAIPTYLLSEFAARHVKVALSGDGGDELFAGYTRYQSVRRQAVLDRIPLALRSVIEWTAGRLPYSAYGKNWLRMISRQTSAERYFESNYAPYYLRERLLAREWMLPGEDGFLSRLFADALGSEASSTLSRAMSFEIAVNLPGDMLVKVDRMSMANSLEVRCPFLDHELAELAATIPPEWNMREGRGKQLLLRALGGRLPPELLTRPKMGFAVPLADWLRGPLREILRDHLLSKRFFDRGIVSPEFVRVLIAEHESRRRDNHTWLWSLLMFELWIRGSENRAPPTPVTR